MRMHIPIFESLQLECSYVGDLLYSKDQAIKTEKMVCFSTEALLFGGSRCLNVPFE